MAIKTDKLHAIVLAGGMNRIELFPGYVPGHKALLNIHGRPSVMYTLDALREVPGLERICIVGPVGILRETIEGAGGDDWYEYVEGGETFVESVEHGLRQIGGSEPVLVVTADMPLITSAAINDFLAAIDPQGSKYDSNIYISLVPKEAYEGPYDHFPKNFNPFRDHAVCHGNVLLVDPALLKNEEALRRINALYNARKHPIEAALSVGLRVGLSYAFGVQATSLLSLSRMARIASWRFKVGLIPVLVNHPEITIDIDEAKDYNFVVEQLES